MNPIISLLKTPQYNDSDYQYIQTKISRDVEYLKQLNINTIKEMLYKTLNNKLKLNITMDEIQQMSENDCAEYNKLYNITNVQDFMILTNTEKSKLTLAILNDGQRSVVYDILEKLSCSFNPSGILVDPTVVLLDAPSGTGKSFLIDCLYLCMRFVTSTVIARNKTLLKNICTVEELTTQTTCKFIMQYLNMTYEEAIHAFKDSYATIEELNEFIARVVGNCTNWDFNLLIIDEYSMESPLLLTVLLIIAQKEHVNVLIIGDIKQQNTLTPSKFHCDTNYNLLKVIPNIHICKLTEQMRIKDQDLNDIIEGIKGFINIDNSGNVKNTFELQYYIFTKLKSKFSKTGNILKDTYLTDTHKNIKTRVQQLKTYAKKKV